MLPYILTYKPTLKKLPQNEEFYKNSHTSRPPKYHEYVVWANNKRVYILEIDQHIGLADIIG